MIKPPAARLQNCFPTNGTGVLLFNADNVTVTRNTFVGSGTDIGISVSAGSTGNTISFNDVTRTASENPANTDPTGIGINVDRDSSATLICNTFERLEPEQNIVGAIQVACTPLPDGAECEAYSAQAPTVHGRHGGRQRPAVHLGAGVGEPPARADPGHRWGDHRHPHRQPGTFDFTLRVTDADGLTATSDQTITIAPGCASPTPTPSQGSSSAAPTGDAELPDTAVDRRQPTTGADLTLLAASVALLAAGVVLTAVAGRPWSSATALSSIAGGSRGPVVIVRHGRACSRWPLPSSCPRSVCCCELGRGPDPGAL